MIRNLIYILVVFFLLGNAFADTNGVWHRAEDVNGGVFANDEDEKDFSFIGLVTFNNDVFFMSNVGVGTTNPTSKLDIVGDISANSLFDRDNNAFFVDPSNLTILNNLKIDGSVSSTSGVIRDANGGWVRTYGNSGWYSQTHGGGFYMIDSNWVRSYNNKGILTNGEIRGGIVSSTRFYDLDDTSYILDPSSYSKFNSLDVMGGIRILRSGKGIYFDPNNGDLNAYSQIKTDLGMGLALQTSSNAGVDGNLGVFIDSTGKVGIANANPTVSLDVIGDIKASGNIYSNGEKVMTGNSLSSLTYTRSSGGSGTCIGCGSRSVSCDSGDILLGVLTANCAGDAVGVTGNLEWFISSGNTVQIGCDLGNDGTYDGGNLVISCLNLN